MPADPAIPAAKVERVSQAIFCEQMNRGPECTTHHLAEAAIRAAAAYDAQQRAAAGPRPARERDTDAWWAD